MKSMVLSILVIPFLLIACGENNTSDKNTNPQQKLKEQAQPSKVDDLANKTTEEILALKYNQAILTCSFWFQKDEKVNIELPANDSFSLDLKSNSALPQKFEFSASILDHKVKATLVVSSLSHIDNLFPNNNSIGTESPVQYIPHVKVYYYAISRSTFYNGHSYLEAGGSEDVNELQKSDLIMNSLFSKPTPGIPVPHSISYLLSCQIETDVKSEYKNYR